MARNRDPFNQALSALKSAIAGGRLRGGAAVIVADEAERLHLSITPVREALARLNGEGLVERAPGGGYLVTRLEGHHAVDGYRLLEYQLGLAGDLSDRVLGPIASERPALPADVLPGVASAYLFDRIIRSAGNVMLIACHDLIRRRLAPLARAEHRMFGDLDVEADRLYAAAETSWSALEDEVHRHFDRRVRAAPALVRIAEDEIGPDQAEP